MNPRMVILNNKEYQLKFDEAMAYSLSDQHGKALNLLLELKQKRWRKFELFKMIAEQYIALGQHNQAQMIMKEINPIDQKQKQESLELEQLTKQQIGDINQNYPQQQEDRNEDDSIFNETKELQLQKQDLQYFENQKQKDQGIHEEIDCVSLYNSGYNQSFQTYYQAILGQPPSRIKNLNHQEQIKVLSFLACFEDYKLVLSLIETVVEDVQILVIKAYCFIQIKQYKLALEILRRAYGSNQCFYLQSQIQQLHFLLGLKEIKIDSIEQKIELIPQLSFRFWGKFFNMFGNKYKIILINILQESIKQDNNIEIYLYRELFQLEYSISINSPILWRICDFLVKYAPRFSAGYAQQYQLFTDKQLMDKAFSLEQPLLQCEDCTLKFKTLAKLYQEQKQFSQAHQALEKAKTLNEFDEEIYQIERDLFRIQKMYQKAYLTIRHLVQLERENYFFICQIIAPMIDKFEYYKVLDLLQLVDNDSRKFDALQLLFRILSYKTDQDDEQILKSIESLNQSSIVEFLGHYWLSKNQIEVAVNYYEQIERDDMYQSPEYIHFHQQIKTIEQLKQVENLNQHEITDFICQIGILNYNSSQDKANNIHQRYVNTIGFILTSIVYNESLEENVKIINSKYDMEVPLIKGFKQAITSIVERIYCQSYISSEKYQSYVGKGLSQLQILFVSTETFMDSFYEFSDGYKQKMIQQFMELDHELTQIDGDLQKIYKIPFFADPISRYALVSVIKMIGYYTEFELVNNYQRVEEWLTNYMIKQNMEAYYKIITKQTERL